MTGRRQEAPSAAPWPNALGYRFVDAETRSEQAAGQTDPDVLKKPMAKPGFREL